MINEELKQKVKDLYKAPFRFDEMGGYVFDDGNMVLEVRGWGRIQYLEDGQILQDQVGYLIANIMTEHWTSN